MRLAVPANLFALVWIAIAEAHAGEACLSDQAASLAPTIVVVDGKELTFCLGEGGRQRCLRLDVERGRFDWAAAPRAPTPTKSPLETAGVRDGRFYVTVCPAPAPCHDVVLQPPAGAVTAGSFYPIVDDSGTVLAGLFHDAKDAVRGATYELATGRRLAELDVGLTHDCIYASRFLGATLLVAPDGSCDQAGAAAELHDARDGRLLGKIGVRATPPVAAGGASWAFKLDDDSALLLVDVTTGAVTRRTALPAGLGMPADSQLAFAGGWLAVIGDGGEVRTVDRSGAVRSLAPRACQGHPVLTPTAAEACFPDSLAGARPVTAWAAAPDGKTMTVCLRGDADRLCARLDVASGRYQSLDVGAGADQDPLDDPDLGAPAAATSARVAGGARVCKDGACRDVRIVGVAPGAGMAVNDDGTLVATVIDAAAGEPHPHVAVFDVATGGKALAVVRPSAKDGSYLCPYPELLGDVLLEVGTVCAGPGARGRFFDARSGRLLGALGGRRTVNAYGIQAARVRGNVWAFAPWDADRLILEDVRSARVVREITIADPPAGGAAAGGEEAGPRVFVVGDHALLGYGSGGVEDVDLVHATARKLEPRPCAKP